MGERGGFLLDDLNGGRDGFVGWDDHDEEKGRASRRSTRRVVRGSGVKGG
jgi:hypothetical protein